MTKTDKEELQIELKARNQVIKRLAYPIKQLETAVEKETQLRKARAESLMAYKTCDDVMNAYGWGDITDNERRMLIDAIEDGARCAEETNTPAKLALKILNQFIRTMQTEKQELEFALLSPEEQQIKKNAAEKRKAELEARIDNRRGRYDKR